MTKKLTEWPFENGQTEKVGRHRRFLAREQVFYGEYLKAGEFPERRIERGPITKIMPSDGCKGDTVFLAVGRWYNFYEFGCHLENVG